MKYFILLLFFFLTATADAQPMSCKVKQISPSGDLLDGEMKEVMVNDEKELVIIHNDQTTIVFEVVSLKKDLMTKTYTAKKEMIHLQLEIFPKGYMPKDIEGIITINNDSNYYAIIDCLKDL